MTSTPPSGGHQRPPWPGPPPWGAPPWGPSVPPPYPPSAPAGWGGHPPAPQTWAGHRQPPQRPVHAHPQPYHRLLRTTTYRWWRPVVGLVVAVAAWLFMSLGITLPALVGAALLDTSTEDLLDPGEPVGLLVANLLLASLIPAVWLAVALVHRQHVGWLSSVVARFRWRLMGVLALLALAVVAATMVLSFFVPAEVGGEGEAVGTGVILATVAVVLLTTPLQAAGEEYAFRGYLTQVTGCWTRSPWPAALATALLFAVAHGSQDVWLFADRFAFGLVASWLTWRTGGLEAAVAYHAVGNVVVLLVAAAGGDLGATLDVTEIPVEYLLLDVAGMVGFAWLAARVARRRGVATRSGGAPPGGVEG